MFRSSIPHASRRSLFRLLAYRRACAWLLAASLVSISTAGCAASQPHTEVLSATLTPGARGAALVTFTLCSKNPRDTALPVRLVRYTVTLDGSRVYSGQWWLRASLPARGSHEWTVPAPVELGASRPSSWRFTGTLVHETSTSLRRALHDAGVPRPTSPVDGAGVFLESPGVSPPSRTP